MICISDDELEIVLDIIKRLHPKCRLLAFGSRFKWTSKDYSDLDLAIEGEEKIPFEEMSKIKDAFEESNLNFSVDLIDLRGISEEFKEIVMNGNEEIYNGMNGWKKVKLKEIAEIKYGKDHKKIGEGSIPIYGTGGIMRYGNQSLSNEESILIPRKGTLTNIYYVARPFWTVDTLFWTRINITKVFPKFLYYQIKILDLASMNVGTAVPSLTTKDLNEIEINLPSLETQQKIASILSSFDDKIELNNEMNKTLEEVAQTLFKQWFIDFEFPNEKGEPYKSSGGKMVESELGEIPEGWKVGTVSDLGVVIGGSTPSKARTDYYTNKGTAWITPKDLSNNKNKFISKGEIDITDLGLKNSSTQIMPKGTILFSSRAPIGYIAISKNNVTTNQGFKSVVPKSNIGTAYVYYFLKNNLEFIENRASGSTFKEVSGSVMKQIPALIPNDNTLFDFKNMCSLYFEKQTLFEEQNQTLVAVRDTLIPKLMSGKIEV